MKNKCIIATLLICLHTSILVASGTSEEVKLPLHQGTYLGADIGGNLNKVSFQIQDKNLPYIDFHSVAQSMFLGYFFNPHWAIESAIASYFSGIGLSTRGNLRGAIALSHRMALSLGVGAVYLATPLKDSFIGPYADIRMSYTLTPKIDIQVTVSDTFTLYQFNSSLQMTDHFLSFLAGFTYHI